MARLNLLLLLVALACALATVAANHGARKLFTEFEREQTRMRELEVEYGQLQLEQSTWAGHARIEKIARERLAMRPPPPARVVQMEAAPR
ncbi:MAG: cell division protein FtsL [Rhodocyclaceae bacterium]|jgi:cell division protein FtsL|nr:cell division protein FtsL [Rhodocyclaceae bacterium]MBK6555262.1 cell division protein FtsL [Rhodocyclaceae bacterium]MBK6676827.1 cell division protein FtsL [Rhodocyclaceae bacterium]MBK7815718.1 cell division protein FtsL [Rhodocyclaceae bacterium]MBK9309455.1 cell division protein FtsL [Rhodocyclaceae bacterium]